MPTWGWILIAAVAVLLIAAIVMSIRKKQRTKQLQSQFGPEYDRTIESADSRRKAESELAARQERREQLDIRPLSSAARERYTTQWQTVQAQFVDNPSGAVALGGHADPVGDGRPRLSRRRLREPRGRRLRRPPARRRELSRGTPARGAVRERQRLDRGAPPGDAALPRALRRARRAGRRRRCADDARAHGRRRRRRRPSGRRR